jgi:hypothetical protein
MPLEAFFIAHIPHFNLKYKEIMSREKQKNQEDSES